MNHNFSDKLREAMAARKRTNLPNLNLIIISSVMFTLAYIILALFAIPGDRLPDYHFVSEDGAITALSAVYLAMACSFSIASLVVTIRAKEPHIWSWVIMISGFGLLALDEVLQFHERFGRFIEQHISSGIFRNWSDIIVIAYGIIALLIIVSILPSIMRHKMLLELFIVAFIFYCITTLIDSTQEPKTTISVILEESVKLFCVLFLALGTFVAFIGSLWNLKPSDISQNEPSTLRLRSPDKIR